MSYRTHNHQRIRATIQSAAKLNGPIMVEAALKPSSPLATKESGRFSPETTAYSSFLGVSPRTNTSNIPITDKAAAIQTADLAHRYSRVFVRTQNLPTP